MKTTLKIKVKISSDTSFIERIATWDPFDYWNRCIVLGSSKDQFLNPDETVIYNSFIKDETVKMISAEGSIHEFERVTVKIEKSGTMPFNYIVTYHLKGNLHINYGKTHQEFIEALIMYHGYLAVEVESI